MEKKDNIPKVYKIVNDKDSKVYVGSTTEPLNVRLSKHKSRAKIDNRPLYKHMKQLGPNHFHIVLLEAMKKSKRQYLADKESYYQLKLGSVGSLNGKCAQVNQDKQDKKASGK